MWVNIPSSEISRSSVFSEVIGNAPCPGNLAAFGFAGGGVVDLQSQPGEFGDAERDPVIKPRGVHRLPAGDIARDEGLLTCPGGSHIRHVAVMDDGRIIGPDFDRFEPRFLQEDIR
jgi:hypothetical protein